MNVGEILKSNIEFNLSFECFLVMLVRGKDKKKGIFADIAQIGGWVVLADSKKNY